MSKFRCIVQAGSNAEVRGDELERRLRDHHTRHYPAEDATIGWMAIPPGYMFTEGRQSTSSIISCFIDHPTTLDDREKYMRGICDLWTEVTECTDHEIVVSVTEAVSASQE